MRDDDGDGDGDGDGKKFPIRRMVTPLLFIIVWSFLNFVKIVKSSKR